MKVIKFKTINSYVSFFAVVLSVIIGLYAFIPQVLATINPINEKQIEKLLREHKSFVGDGNIEGMLSVYHPDFSMEVIHSSGHKESFNKSQMSKYQENLQRITSLVLEEKSQQISMINSNQALVATTMHQYVSIKGLPISNKEQLYQSMLIVKHNGEPKILKVLSSAIKQ